MEMLDYRSKYKINKTLLWLSFLLYMMILLWAVILKMTDVAALTHKKQIAFSYQSLSYRFMYQFRDINYKDPGTLFEFVCNFIITLPLGIYLPLLFNKRINPIRDLLISLVFILCIEFSQWFSTLGGISYRDVINNMFGVTFGLILYQYLIHPYCDNKWINQMLLGTLIIFTPLLIYAIIKTVTHYDIYIPYLCK